MPATPTPRSTVAGRSPGPAADSARAVIGRLSQEMQAASDDMDFEQAARIRDRIDREYAQPLDVERLARDAHMSAGHLSRQFKAAYGESPYLPACLASLSAQSTPSRIVVATALPAAPTGRLT